MEQRNTFLVSGSYGVLSVDEATGKVLTYDCGNNEALYSNIDKFDINEYILAFGQLDKVIDILNISCWTTDGEFNEYSHNHRQRHTHYGRP